LPKNKSIGPVTFESVKVIHVDFWFIGLDAQGSRFEHLFLLLLNNCNFLLIYIINLHI